MLERKAPPPVGAAAGGGGGCGAASSDLAPSSPAQALEPCADPSGAYPAWAGVEGGGAAPPQPTALSRAVIPRAKPSRRVAFMVSLPSSFTASITRTAGSPYTRVDPGDHRLSASETCLPARARA